MLIPVLPSFSCFIPKSLYKIVEKWKEFRTESVLWGYLICPLILLIRCPKGYKTGYVQSLPPPLAYFLILLPLWTWLHSVIFQLLASPLRPKNMILLNSAFGNSCHTCCIARTLKSVCVFINTCWIFLQIVVQPITWFGFLWVDCRVQKIVLISRAELNILSFSMW